MKNWISSPQTSIGAIIALAGVILAVMGKDTVGISLIGVGATWIGINSKENNKPS